MQTETKAFLLHNRINFFDWLHKHADSFPFCCVVSTEILASYLQVHCGEGEAVSGDWRVSYRDGSWFDIPHSWVRIGEIIVDFTYIQFEVDSYDSFLEDHNTRSSEELILLADKLDEQIFVTDETLKLPYRVGHWDHAIREPIYKREAVGVDFLTYLKRMEDIIVTSGHERFHESLIIK